MLVKSADSMMKYKWIIQEASPTSTAKSATFMPKPIFGDNGSGMHTLQSLWSKAASRSSPATNTRGFRSWRCGTSAAFSSTGPAWLRLHRAHHPNSYKRLVPGYEAPVNLAYSSRNRSAAVRIPMYSNNPKAKRLEFRPPDPSCNVYLAFSAMLMAGLDGIKHKINPGQPLEKDIFELSGDEAKKVPSMPGSLEAALQHLEDDHDYLLEGGVFGQGLIDTWIEYKRKNEADAVRMRPHPYEFHLYYDI